MTNYNDGEWHRWDGGECPVHPESVVEVLCERHGILSDHLADNVYWRIGTSIIAFRVTKEHKEPREFWAKMYGEAWCHVSGPCDGAVKFREVLE